MAMTYHEDPRWGVAVVGVGATLSLSLSLLASVKLSCHLHVVWVPPAGVLAVLHLKMTHLLQITGVF